MSETNGYIAWNELMTRDVELAKTYYTHLCGWSYHPMKMPGGQDYFVALLDGAAAGGIMDTSDIPSYDKMPVHWLTYIGVGDVDAEVAKTEQMGGVIMRDPITIPGIGRIAIVKDPAGAMVGLITEAEPVEEAPPEG